MVAKCVHGYDHDVSHLCCGRLLLGHEFDRNKQNEERKNCIQLFKIFTYENAYVWFPCYFERKRRDSQYLEYYETIIIVNLIRNRNCICIPFLEYNNHLNKFIHGKKVVQRFYTIYVSILRSMQMGQS